MKCFLSAMFLATVQARVFRHRGHHGITGFLGSGIRHHGINFHAVFSLADPNDLATVIIDYYDCDTTSTTTCLNAGPTWTTNGTELIAGLNVAATTTADGIKITASSSNGLNLYEIEFTPKNGYVANHLLTKIITYEQEALEESYVCAVGNDINAATGACSPCQSDKYAELGAKTCTSCPDSSTSVVGSDELSDCKCPAGTNATASGCTDCPNHSYNPAGDQVGTPTQCTSCPDASTTYKNGTFQDDISDCACPAGTSATASGCTPCTNDKYNVNEYKVGSGGTCTSCPDASTSVVGSDELSDCKCPAGTNATASGCTDCPNHSYNPAGDQVGTPTQCTSCPDASTTNGVGDSQDHLSDCACPAGTSATASGCTDCPNHSYNPAGDNVNTTTSSQCTDCPDASTTYGDGEFQDHISDCACPLGTNATGSGCEACPTGTFNNNTDPAAPATTCDVCPTGKFALITGQDLCTDCGNCTAGEERLNCGGSSPGGCSDCVPGKYGQGAGTVDEGVPEVCIPCNAGSYTDTGVASGAGECTQCPDDTYSTQSNVDACTACPTGKVSPTGSNEESDCVWSSIMYGYVKLSSNGCLPTCASWHGELTEGFTSSGTTGITQLDASGTDTVLCNLLQNTGQLIKEASCH